MINQILVDLDDVCNHFTMTALSMLLGRQVEESEFPVWVGYDLTAAYNVLNLGEDVTVDEFWPMVTPDIWSYMPRREDTDWLLDLCAECVGRENVLICTKSLGHPMHFVGKIQWMYDNLPNWIQGQYSITPLKHAYARHDVMLIDDCAGNVDKFTDTRNGRAILVPRPWNRHYRLDSHMHIEECLENATMCM
jgi:hypothetical protein